MHRPTPFGKYILLERISVGGMAEVFKAKSFGVEGFARSVAIKRILPHLAEDPRFVEMFINEAKVAVQLSHANVAQVYELGRFESDHYIAMEYVAGKDLLSMHQYTKKTGDRLPMQLAAYIGSRVAEGLGYAHRKTGNDGRPLGIIHRDISPQNVLISYEGAVKLIDFGIAKAAIHSSHQTQAGVLKGKYGYMSPEQITGKPLDQRSDIFALGTVLHEMLTGERLFCGDNDFLTLEKVRAAKADPPSRHNPDVPPQLDQIILRALAREPSERYQTATQFADDLGRFLHMSGAGLSSKALKSWMRTRFAGDIANEEGKDEQFARLTLTAEGDLLEVAQNEEDATALWDPLSEDMLPEGMHFEKEEPKPRVVSIVRRDPQPDPQPEPELDESLTAPSPVSSMNLPPQSLDLPQRTTPSPPVVPDRTAPTARSAFGHDDPTGIGIARRDPAEIATTTTMPPKRGIGRREIVSILVTLLLAGAGGIGVYFAFARDGGPESGRVRLEVSPADGLKVTLDGAAHPGDTSPIDLGELPTGPHELRIERAGHETVTRTIEVGAGEDRQISIALEARSDSPGLLKLKIEPAGGEARVTVGGEAVPQAKWGPGVEVPSGAPVEIAVDRRGFRPLRQSVTLRPGEEQTAALTLEPTPASMLIDSNPPATVYIDGKRVGRTSLTVNDLDPTVEHAVRLEARGFEPYETKVSFTGESRFQQLNVELER